MQINFFGEYWNKPINQSIDRRLITSFSYDDVGKVAWRIEAGHAGRQSILFWGRGETIDALHLVLGAADNVEVDLDGEPVVLDEAIFPLEQRAALDEPAKAPRFAAAKLAESWNLVRVILFGKTWSEFERAKGKIMINQSIELTQPRVKPNSSNSLVLLE